MQGKDIIKSVRQLLQDDSYDSDLILKAASWFVFELANNNKLRMFESSAELNATAGDTSVPFPNDSIAWTGIYVTTPRVYSISDDYTEYGDFMGSFAGFAQATAANPGRWTMFGDGMRFSAPLLVDTTFQIDYVGEPKEMVRPADDCPIPARYSELVARGTKARILEIDEDYDYAAQERDILDPLLTTFIRNEARGGGKTKPTVIRTNRRGAGRSGGVPRLGE